MTEIYVFFADGFEEIEGLTVVDLLRRASQKVRMVSINDSLRVTGAHGISIEADLKLDQVSEKPGDFLVLPGGMPGTRNLGACRELTEKLVHAAEKAIHVAAICAAPSVLGDLGLLKGKQAVCYPGFEERLTGAKVLEVPVVTDGNVTTSRGMGTAIPFGLELIRLLSGKEEADRIGCSILYQ
ncbi:MAG: DJ-1 family glyoxalase III [Candidatus Limivivens sp.]|nr:DJ-1 family glyoxalase III [Candidatus Limivivens sp.]